MCVVAAMEWTWDVCGATEKIIVMADSESVYMWTGPPEKSVVARISAWESATISASTAIVWERRVAREAMQRLPW